MSGMASSGWQEVYDGGSPEAEQEIFQALAADMLILQEANRQKSGAAHANRTLHAKIVVGITDARLIIDPDLPERFRAAHFQPGASLPTTVRLSNASGVIQGDDVPDMRGAALKIALPDGTAHDLLMTSFPVSHARNARQFVMFAVIASGDRAQMLPRMITAFGEAETQRMLGNIKQGVRPSASLATERYWSRGAILWGNAGPVRYSLIPADDTAPNLGPPADGPESLRSEFEERVRHGDVTFRLALQSFVSEERTPIEDGATEWTEADAPPVEIATLILPQQDLSAAGAVTRSRIDALAFNPWHAPAEFRPLGNLNRARKTVYAASAERWLKKDP